MPMRNHITIGFDLAETEIYERVGESDAFMARLTVAEAGLLRDEIDKRIQEVEDEQDW